MKNFIKFILLMIGCSAMFAWGDRIYGLERMERFDLLPNILEGTQVRQVSSHDRSGGNDDGFSGDYSALYIDENGEYVLFDEMGAGCLYRFWMTYAATPTNYPDRRLRFYFDNEATPRLDLSISEFFDGVGAPLEFPLVGPFDKSSHGCYCYLPFPYGERLKITLSDLPYFYQMTYHRFDSPEGVESWTGSEDASAILTQWNAAGTDPKPGVSNVIVSGNLSLATGATGTLFNVTEEGAIQSIKIDPAPNSMDILSGMRLQMNWDGGTPEVVVPLGDFFGSGRQEFNVLSLPIGMRTSGDWYCFFPMPYWESAEIQLINDSGTALTDLPFEIQYTTNVYDRAKAGYFHAVFHEESLVNNATDFNFIDESGRGHVVGVSLFMESSGSGGYEDMNYLEGDERAYVDENQSPCIYGTGTEDYFNCGWYFNWGLFSRPYHGHPWHDQFNGGGTNYTQAYRMHISDSIPFNQSVKFGIEHGHANAAPGIYSSVTYYYLMEEAGLVPVADLDHGDAWSEMVYDYPPVSAEKVVSNGWTYGGDYDDIALHDVGYAFSNSLVSFTVPLINDGAGLLLRRMTDQGIGGQKAYVFVDDVYAGMWYEADHNFETVSQRWLDSEFMVASNLLAGKTSVEVSLVSLSSQWNEYRYRAYCVKPLRLSQDSDNDQLPDDYEMELVSSLAILDGAVDTDGDGLLDRDEYIAGTHPLNPASFFAINSDYSFNSAVGRLYQLQECTNLVSNSWVTVRYDIPGTGNTLSLPIATTNSAAFHRLQVELP